MADRYWVGGTGSWDGTAGTKWSATSGGAGGASVPTSADDVFFNASSTGSVTIATGNTGAKSINCTGFTGTLTGTAAISVAGSITLVTGMTYTHTGTVTFTGTGTLTTAGKSFSATTVNASGITLTLGDALNCSTRNITITQGTFTTANYSVTCGTFSSNNSNTRTINLGTSTVTASSSIDFGGSNFTFSSGTSQINCSASTAVFNGGGQTFYNVSFTSTTAGTRQLSGTNTFNNLTLNASATGLSQLQLSQDQTVNGTLACAGTSATQRGFIFSQAIGTTRTITTAAISANDCDFRDITIAGGGAGASPTRAGNCGGNSGITFPAAKTVYRVGTNTTWAGSSSWATGSGGAGSNDNLPLAQDTAVIDESTTLTGTLALAFYNIGALNCSTRTTGITLNYNSSANWHGSHTLGSGITVSGVSLQNFLGRANTIFTSAGKTITFPIYIWMEAGEFQLGDAFNSTSTNGNGGSSIEFIKGTINASSYNLTMVLFYSTSSLSRTITMGSGLWTFTGTGSIWSIFNPGTFTVNKDTANILLSNTSTSARTFAPSHSFNKLTIGGATGTSVLTLGNSSFTELASTKTVAHTIRLSANMGTIDTWTVTGTVGNVVTLDSSSAGTRRTFTLTNATSAIDYMSVKDIGELSAGKFAVGANSTDGGNNSNVYFADLPTVNTGNMLMLF